MKSRSISFSLRGDRPDPMVRAAPRAPRSWAPLIAAVLATARLGVEPAAAQFQSAIGYTELQNQLGSSLPTGSSVAVSQTEASLGTDANGNALYLPDFTNAEFSGKTLNAKSGALAVSSHATEVGQYYYGEITSTTPGVPTVDVYNANDWLVGELLNFGTTSLPLREIRPFENHSWIGTIDNGGSEDLEALERFDYAMQASGFLGVVGLNNGSSSTIPQLLACAYDSIAVGLTNGNHSTGTTSVDGPGRIKPEIVAPVDETSFATPMVSSAGALLLDAIHGNSAYANAADNVTLKAMLLAGATKSQIPGWSRTPTQPLDSHYGAGQLNIYDSYHILVAGQQPASISSAVRSRGWDSSSTTAGGNLYFFEIAAGDSTSNFSALLTWNVIVASASRHQWENVTATLPNLALNIYTANNFTVGSLVDSSVSAVDNVQHLYEPNLPPGQYALEVTANTTGVAYGLAWYSIPTVTIANTADAYEQGLASGVFIVTRAGETVDPLTVTYTTGGSAVSGTNYAAIPSSVTIPAGAASIAMNIAPVAYTSPQGDQTVVLTLASDFGYSIGAAGAATVIIHDLPYNDWLLANFTTAQLADPSISGPNADPANDGIPNLLKYALNLNPNVPSAAGLPSVGLSGGQPAFTYTQVTAATDIAYTVQLSTDLVNWSSTSTTVSQVINEGSTQLITVVSQLPLASNPRQFFRLAVTQP